MDFCVMLQFIFLILNNQFLSTLMGALIGGLFVLGGTVIAAHLDRKNKSETQYDLLQATLEAISTELETAFIRYRDTIGILIANLRNDEEFAFYYYATENYFPIYNSNAFLLGHLKNKKLREEIISVHTSIKSLLDGFKLNNKIYADFEDLTLSQNINNNPSLLLRIANLRANHIRFSVGLRREHDQLILDLPRLLKNISESIKLKEI